MGFVYRIATIWSGENLPSEFSNITYWEDVSLTQDSTVTDVLLSFDVQFRTALRQLITNRCNLLRYECSLPASPTVILGTQPVNEQGLFGTATCLPPQNAALIRLDYTGMNDRHPGKWFQPNIPLFTSFANAVLWYNTYFGNLSFLLRNQFGSTTGLDAVYAPVIWHRLTSTTSPVTFASTMPGVYTQRDRADAPNTRKGVIDTYCP